MDNLTHTLTGLTLSRCGLNRGHAGTAAMLMLAANAPDIDAYSFFSDSVAYLDIHRGYTHALVFVPLMALLPIAIVKLVTRSRPQLWPTLWQWFACMLAVLSHLALDWTNVYGIRLLLPFSDRWLRLDITDIVDPIIWAILIACLAVPSVLSLVGSEIGSRKATGGKPAWAWIAILGLLAYEGVRWNSHERAVDRLSALLYQGEPAKQVYAFPARFDFLNWRGVVEGQTFYQEMPVNRAGEFTMNGAKMAYKPEMTSAMEAARATRTFRAFERFNQVPLWESSPAKDATQVELFDLRFGPLDQHGFTATALVESSGRVREERFSFGR
jgi:inner membrane protein